MNPLLLNLKNGTVDLAQSRALCFREQCRLDRLTKVAGTYYNHRATCPTWEGFLEKIFCGDQELIRYLQRVVGYSLTGLSEVRGFWIFYGLGKNGKSTFLNTIRTLLGDYARESSFATFVQQKDGDKRGPSPELAELVGVRFVSASEGEKTSHLAEAMIKRITGNEPITVRKIFGDPFTYSPHFKLFLATNNKPMLSGDDQAIWDRVNLIPFNYRFTADEVDERFGAKLEAELPGILNWAIAGYYDWAQQGMNRPNSVSDSTGEYQKDSDSIGRFFEQTFVLDPLGKISNKRVMSLWEQWCADNYEHVRSSKSVRERLFAMGLSKGQRTAEGDMWQGFVVRLTDGSAPAKLEPEPEIQTEAPF